MVTTLEHGITISTLVIGTLVQSVKVSEKTEKSIIVGMHSDDTSQIKKVTGHSKVNEFSVTGHGDLTLATGVGDADISLISGGVVFIDQVDYEQNVKDHSKWSYNGVHYPYAA